MVTRRAGRAFTMIEMIVALAVLAILTSMTFVAINAVLSRADVQQARADLQAVRTAQLRFAATYGTFTPHPPDLSSHEVATGVFEVPSLDVTVQAGPLNPHSASWVPGTISFAVGNDGALGLAKLTVDGVCVGMTVPAANVTGASVERELPDDAVCEGRALLPAGQFAVPSDVSAKW